jgi:hypothetical protein
MPLHSLNAVEVAKTYQDLVDYQPAGLCAAGGSRVEYLMQGRRVPPQVIDIIGELVSAEVRQVFKSTADLLREEGEARGRAEGEARGRAEGEARGRAEGEARGRAKDILRILAAHRVPVSSELEDVILGCRDLAQLDRWFDRALTARTVDDMLRDD